jgi:membrane protease YdiL (CAAX protease family)
MKKSLFALGLAMLLSQLATANFELKLDEPSLNPEAHPSNVFVEKSYKYPWLAVALSIVPGGGHVYLGDFATAGGLFGLTALGVGITGYQSYRICNLYKNDVGGDCLLAATDLYEAYRFRQYALKDPLRWLGAFGLSISSNTMLYSFYAAYRDARIHNDQAGYQYKMPTETLDELAYAPFSLNILKKPEVWGGVLAALAVGLSINYLAFPPSEAVDTTTPGFGMPLIAFPVGIGEETFFRGYLQPAFSEWATPWGGVALSSLVFGAAHVGNAYALPPQDQWRYHAFILPFITSFGFYMGSLVKKNTSLKETTAIHVWYDFIVFALASSGMSATVGSPKFNFTIPF